MRFPLDRRHFLRGMAAGGATLMGSSLLPLAPWSLFNRLDAATLRPRGNGRLGPLVQSPDCPELWIPEGFRVVALSRSHGPSLVDSSFLVPNAMDGMAAFPLPNGNVRLIRNHEMQNPADRPVPLGDRPYDPLASGGTTSLEVALRGEGADLRPELLAEYVSLGGTHVNCAGGLTPWNTWLSCEETTAGPTQGFARAHGYIFEVPVSAVGSVDPVPLPAMGRMVHEATAVDPETGIVYETEDMRWRPEADPPLPGSGFYRFIPNRPGELVAGGRLQVLAVLGSPGYHTVTGQQVGQVLPVEWLDIENPDPAEAETDPSALFREAYDRGAARFERLEGCFWGDGSCYFVSTSGGDAGAGQVWRYLPGPDGGTLTLLFESPSHDILDSPDNICTAPDGSIVLCEDGSEEQFIRVLRQDSVMLDLVKQPMVSGEPEPHEFAGSCFSPDGRVLFFNVQGSTTSYGDSPGATYAMWGPWERLSA